MKFAIHAAALEQDFLHEFLRVLAVFLRTLTPLERVHLPPCLPSRLGQLHVDRRALVHDVRLIALVLGRVLLQPQARAKLMRCSHLDTGTWILYWYQLVDERQFVECHRPMSFPDSFAFLTLHGIWQELVSRRWNLIIRTN